MPTHTLFTYIFYESTSIESNNFFYNSSIYFSGIKLYCAKTDVAVINHGMLLSDSCDGFCLLKSLYVFLVVDCNVDLTLTEYKSLNFQLKFLFYYRSILIYYRCPDSAYQELLYFTWNCIHKLQEMDVVEPFVLHWWINLEVCDILKGKRVVIIFCFMVVYGNVNFDTDYNPMNS